MCIRDRIGRIKKGAGAVRYHISGQYLKASPLSQGLELVFAIAPIVVAGRGGIIPHGSHQLGDGSPLFHGGKGLPVEGIPRVQHQGGLFPVDHGLERGKTDLSAAGGRIVTVQVVGVHDLDGGLRVPLLRRGECNAGEMCIRDRIMALNCAVICS